MRSQQNIETRDRTGIVPSGRIAVLAAALLICTAFGAPAWAMQILSATDHAELRAEVSAHAVSRIALAHDRIARVIRGPDGFTVEHDAARGDLYLRPAASGAPDQAAAPASRPATLFIGTEKGFTYRLVLTVTGRDSAQVLIRNADAAAPVTGEDALRSDAHRSALVTLIRAVARREPLPGYVIEARAQEQAGTVTAIETWRGPRFSAHVVEAADGAPADAGEIAALFAPGIAAAWVSAPGSGPAGGRLAVVVQGSRYLGEPR